MNWNVGKNEMGEGRIFMWIVFKVNLITVRNEETEAYTYLRNWQRADGVWTMTSSMEPWRLDVLWFPENNKRIRDRK